MPKKIDPQLRARCVRLVREHQQEYPTLTAATPAVAGQEGVSRESVRRWLAEAEIDDGTRDCRTFRSRCHLSVRESPSHLEKIYGSKVSTAAISRVTDVVTANVDGCRRHLTGRRRHHQSKRGPAAKEAI